VLLACTELVETLEFFTQELGLGVESIFPADDPARAVLWGHGLRVELRRGLDADAGCLVFEVDGEAPDARIAPNGTRIEFVSRDRPVELPALESARVLTRMGDDCAWGEGRAGMLYRDLIPGRLGGRFIASHIRIEAGGPVPDYAHFHQVRFQMIFCYRGWVRVVYEDQGEPFVLQAGDCVIQPPTIRHQVLESSPGLEVIEIGCPAQHETHADREILLPTGRLAPERDFGGQRFVRHVATEATWIPWHVEGFSCREFGFREATDGLAEARVVRFEGGQPSAQHSQGEFHFLFVLRGDLVLEFAEELPLTMKEGDCIVIPAGEAHRFASCGSGLELLELTLPADPTYASAPA
jgi:quercetin dioxygenase-like cupin family protein